MLVLATTGRKSGLTRKTPVTYLPYDGRFLIGGGAGGQKATPDWVLNLRALPKATITVNRLAQSVTVEEPIGPDRDRAFAALAQRWPSVRRYEQWGGRPLPLFILRAI